MIAKAASVPEIAKHASGERTMSNQSARFRISAQINSTATPKIPGAVRAVFNNSSKLGQRHSVSEGVMRTCSRKPAHK
jgi:hypothetical protein